MTSFTVTQNKGKETEKSYTINLMVDVVSTMTEEEIVLLAEDAKKVKLQSPLRDTKRFPDTHAMQEYLRKTYPEAIVTEGVVKAPSLNGQLKALTSILGEEEVARLLTEALAKKGGA